MWSRARFIPLIHSPHLLLYIYTVGIYLINSSQQNMRMILYEWTRERTKHIWSLNTRRINEPAISGATASRVNPYNAGIFLYKVNYKRLNQLFLLHLNTYMLRVYVHYTWFNPLSPHDALKHHFTSLKTNLIFLQIRVLERKLPWNCFANTWQFSLIWHPPQVIFIHYKSRIATAISGL